MIINIANHGGSIVWEGIYYFALSDYPNISDWELRNIILFFEYEKQHSRKTEIICEDKDIFATVNHALTNPSLYLTTPKPDLITVPVCTSCKQGGCKNNVIDIMAVIENQQRKGYGSIILTHAIEKIFENTSTNHVCLYVVAWNEKGLQQAWQNHYEN